MLLHLINKMSRILQPSIIFIDGAEKPFYKKVPKAEKQFEPKKIGKKLFKGIVKPILPEDRVLVFSVTGQPWAAKAAGLKKTYERVSVMVFEKILPFLLPFMVSLTVFIINFSLLAL